MPNWVKNKVRIEKKEVIKECYSQYENGYEDFDFDKIIPMPKSMHLTSGGMGALFRQAVKVSNKRSLFCVSAARKSLSIKATDLAFRISIGSRRKVPRWNGLRSIFSQMIFPVTSVTFFLAVTAPVRKSI